MAFARPTWSAGDRESIVDFVLVQTAARHRVVSMEVGDDEWETDHRPLRLRWKVGAGVQHAKKNKKRGGWKRPKTQEGWAKFEAKAAPLLEKWREAETEQREGEAAEARVERLWQSFKAALAQAADEALGRAKAGGKRNMKGWDEETAAWMKKRRMMYQEVKQAEQARERRADAAD